MIIVPPGKYRETVKALKREFPIVGLMCRLALVRAVHWLCYFRR